MNRSTRRGRAARAARALGLATAATLLTAVPASAGAPASTVDGRDMGQWGGYVQGKYGALALDLAGITQAEIGIGEVHGDVNGGGLGTALDKLQWEPAVPGVSAGEYARGSVALAELDVLGATPNIWNADQRAVPQIPNWENAPGIPNGTGVPGVITIGAVTGEVKANWEGDTPVGQWGMLAPGQDGIQAETRTTAAEASLLDLDQLVGLNLGVGPIFGATFAAQTSRVGTIAQPDGSLAAYSEISPSVGGIDLMGGAGNGGISIGAGGTIGPDGTFELTGSTDSTRIRAIANGKPGGADIDGGVAGSEPALPAFELLAGASLANSIIPGSGTNCPTVSGRPDICRIALQPGVSLTLDLGNIWGSITFADIQSGSERVDANGQFSELKFGGLTLDLGVGIPGILGLPRTELGTFTGGIAPISLGVQVPEGGIYALEVVDTPVIPAVPVPPAAIGIVGVLTAGYLATRRLRPSIG